MNSTENNRGACACSSFGKWAVLAIILALALGVLSWATMERRKNIMKTASELPECSTFVELIDKAGMATVLEKDGPFTVFIPTNEAFAKIPQERLTEILNDKSALAAVLLYHMTPQALTAKDLEKPIDCETCVVPKTKIECSQQKYGDGVCIHKNIPCVNGVVYVIDTVQIPPFLTSGQPAPPQPSFDEISVVATEEIEEPATPAPKTPEKTAKTAKTEPVVTKAPEAEKKAETVETKAPEVEKKTEIPATPAPTPAPTPATTSDETVPEPAASTNVDAAPVEAAPSAVESPAK